MRPTQIIFALAVFVLAQSAVAQGQGQGNGPPPPPGDVNIVNTPDVNVANVPEVVVTNTQNNPIPVVQTTASASCRPEDTVELYSNVSAGVFLGFEVIDADGVEHPALVLSSSEVLVVTDVLVTPNTGSSNPGRYEGTISNSSPGGGSYSRIRMAFNSDFEGMLHLPFTSGVVFRQPPSAFAFATNPGAMVIRLLGCIDQEPSA